MKKIYKYLIAIVVILIEVILIFFLIVAIYQKRSDLVLSINYLEKAKFSNSNGSPNSNLIEPEPNQEVVEPAPWLGKKVVYSINSDSLNERFDYEIKKPRGYYRIVALGDSFTYGLMVNTSHNYPERLEDLLNQKLTCSNITKFEVINLGLPGYSISEQIKRFQLRGQKYEPDLVLWLLKENDLVILPEFKEKFEYYLEYVKQNGLEKAIKEFDWKDYRKIKFEKDFITNAQVLGDETQKTIARNTIAETIRDIGGEAALIERQKGVLASLATYHKKDILIFSFDFSFNYQPHLQNLFNDFASSRKHVFFYDDLVNIYLQGGALPDSHPNEEGHFLIAQDLFSYLEKKKIIPCEP